MTDPTEFIHEQQKRDRRTGWQFAALAVVVALLVGFAAYATDARADERTAKDQAERSATTLAQYLAAQIDQFQDCKADGSEADPACQEPVSPPPDVVAGQDGTDGTPGPQGPQGVQGLQGIQGLTGADGKRGPRGFTGLDGAAGPTGQPGKVGAAGANGADGQPGPQGPPGPAGQDGKDGAAGQDGAQGPQGPPGVVAVDDQCDPPAGEYVTGVSTSYDADTRTLVLTCTSAAPLLP